jgi:hypothetical protein
VGRHHPPQNRTLGSGAKQPRTELGDDNRVSPDGLCFLHPAQRPYALLFPLVRAPRNRLVEIDRCKVIREQFAVLVTACGDALADCRAYLVVRNFVCLKAFCLHPLANAG